MEGWMDKRHCATERGGKGGRKREGKRWKGEGRRRGGNLISLFRGGGGGGKAVCLRGINMVGRLIW